MCLLHLGLLTDTELLDDRTITIDVLLGQIAQQIATVTNHLEQTATAVMVVGMLLQMLSQLVDASGQNRDLNLRRTGIGVMQLVLCDDLIFNVLLDHFIFHLSVDSAVSQQTDGDSNPRGTVSN